MREVCGGIEIVIDKKGDSIDENELILGISDLEKKLFKEINYTRYTESEYKKEKKKKNSFILEVIKGKKTFIKGGENDLR